MAETKDTKLFYNTKIPSEWSAKELGDVGKIRMCKRIFNHETSEVGDIPFFKIGTFGKEPDAFIPKELYDDYRKRFSFPKKGEILISAAGTLGRTVVYDGSPAYFQDSNIVWIDNSESTVINQYLFYLYQIIKYESEGGTIQRLYNSIISSAKFLCPPLSEQKAIAQVLSTADAAIQTTEKLIAQKELRKKWLMQQLLTGKKRLKGFDDKFEFRVISQYLNEVSERNKESKVLNVLSVTNSRGFINQSDQFDRSVASEDASNYKIVRKGQFAYNPSRVNVGSLDLLRNFEVGILSPMYVVFETDKANLLPEYFYYQLKSQWFYGHIPMFVQGSVRDSLSFDGLCSMKFFVPSIEEQTAIAHVLQVADKEISLFKAKAEKLREQKKGLMQQLLTGKVRLKID